MRQHAALQLPSKQPFWDLLIPVYYGPPGKRFDPLFLSAVLVQIKSTRQGNQTILGREYEDYFWPSEDTPVLYIMLDLGAPKAEVTLHNPPGRPDVFGIHASGFGAGVYGVSEPFPGLGYYLDILIKERVVQPGIAHDTCVNHSQG